MAKGPNFQSSQRSSVSQPVQLAQKQLIVFFTLLSLPSIAQSFWGVVWDCQLYQFDISSTDDNHVRPCRCSHNVLRHGGRRIVNARRPGRSAYSFSSLERNVLIPCTRHLRTLSWRQVNLPWFKAVGQALRI